MKKLFCLSLLVMGIFVSVQAQSMAYELQNNSATDTWEWGMQDANNNILNSATLGPGDAAFGSFIPFALPLQWRARNNNGCYAYGTITAPTAPVSPPFFCVSPASITYSLQFGGFGNYQLEVEFN